MNKKRVVYTIIGLFILVAGIFTVYAAVIKERGWHDSDNILITVDGFSMTLQEAINNNVFISGATQSSTTEIPNPGHSANKVWVSVNGVETTLQDAISTIGLCGNSSNPYIDSTSLGQFANEIEISPGTSLQDAINSGEFCCAPNTGSSCGGSICVNPGTVMCDGTCVGTSPKNNRGTDCEGVYKACDGNGKCLGWSGYGCGNCPNGVYAYSPYAATMYFCKWQGTFGALQGRMKVDWTSPSYWQAWSYAQISAECEYEYKGRVTNYYWQQKPY